MIRVWWLLMWACAHVGTVLVTFSHRGCSDRHCPQLRLLAILRGWLGILYLKVYSLFLCPEAGRGICNVILLLAWLGKYMMLSETVGVRADLTDVTVLLSGSESWQLREHKTKPGICWNAHVMACAEGKEVEVREVGVQCFGWFFLQKTSLEVDLHKSFVFLSFLSLLD